MNVQCSSPNICAIQVPHEFSRHPCRVKRVDVPHIGIITVSQYMAVNAPVVIDVVVVGLLTTPTERARLHYNEARSVEYEPDEFRACTLEASGDLSHLYGSDQPLKSKLRHTYNPTSEKWEMEMGTEMEMEGSEKKGQGIIGIWKGMTRDG